MEYINIYVDNYIATIVINRPDALNAMNNVVVAELKKAMEECVKNSGVGVIVITGSGEKSFVAGADIKTMQNMSGRQALEFSREGQEMTMVIENSPKPVIAAINGFALGGGCEIALACDMRIASENAKFSQPEVALGIIPGWGGTQRLPRLIGKGRAIEMIASGEMIDAEEALRIGLVNHVIPQPELMEKVHILAKSILKNGPAAVGAALKCIHKGFDEPIDNGLDLELNVFAELFETDEQREGTTAFVEKRKPNFRK
ncbi:MAG: enoyl-CoA hydratase/isomerase family protein [Candidatus Marinimicrobia bacterium]|nr:enoyl-CoA hydratase/isomerase family protein [Candidatus Neomarinimicrobiota bacterium]